MEKDFSKWTTKKVELNNTSGSALFREREIWWCTLGTNIGFEQDGNKKFSRPVVILSKFNLDTCLIVPLTTSIKKGKYYFSVGDITGREAVAVLSQLRFVDRKRLELKITTMDKDSFDKLAKAIIGACFPNIKLLNSEE